MKYIALTLLIIGSIVVLSSCTEENIKPSSTWPKDTNSAHGVVVHDEF